MNAVLFNPLRLRDSKIFGFLVVFVLGSFLGFLQADSFVVPALTGPVVDTAGLLDSSAREGLAAQILKIKETTSAQLAILIVPTLNGLAIEDASIRVTDSWKLGDSKRDDGVLLLMSVEDRKVRIEVGQGLEGAIPDAIAKRIVDRILVPSFKQGDFAGGFSGAVEALRALAAGESPPARLNKSSMSPKGFVNLFIILLGILSLLRSMFRRRGASRFGTTRRSSYYDTWGGGGGWGSGGGGFSSGGGFSGGGGGFSGGGASGQW